MCVGPGEESRAGAGRLSGCRTRIPKAEGRGQDCVRETDIRQGGKDTLVRNLTQVCRPWAPGSLAGGGDVPATRTRLGDPKIWEGTSGGSQPWKFGAL